MVDEVVVLTETGNGAPAGVGGIVAKGEPALPSLVENQVDPTFGKKVKIIIVQTVDCAVYLDEELSTYWMCRGSLDGKLPKDFANVLNRVASLESIPIDSLTKKDQVSFRRLVGEGIARALDDLSDTAAMSVLDSAEHFVAACSAEVSRGWFLKAGLVGMLICVVAAIVSYTLRGDPAWAGSPWVYAGAMGGLGAAVSLISRLRSIQLDPAAGRALHYLESVARLSVGVVGGTIIFLMMMVPVSRR